MALSGVASATITEYSYGTASANVTGGGTPASAFDNNVGNYWQSTAGNWLLMDYGAGTTRQINVLGVYGSTTWYYHFPREFYFEGSNDNTTWTMLTYVNVSNQPTQRADQGVSKYYYYNFTNPTAYRWYRYTPIYTDAGGQGAGGANAALAVELEYKYDDESSMNKPDFYLAPSVNRTWDYTSWYNYTESAFVFRNHQVQFMDSTVNSTEAITNWYWQFGDGTTSTDQNPTKTYTANGSYRVNLTTKVNSVNSSIFKYINVGDLVEYPIFPFGVNSNYNATAVVGGAITYSHDMNTANYWQVSTASAQAGTAYVGMDYGSAVVRNSMMINHGASWPNYAPSEFYIAASNNGVNWTTLYDAYKDKMLKVAPVYIANTKTYFYFNNTDAYRYYRLYPTMTRASSLQEDPTNGVLIPEIDFTYADPDGMFVDYKLDGYVPTNSDLNANKNNPQFSLMTGQEIRFNSTAFSFAAPTSLTYAWDVTNDGTNESTSATYNYTYNTAGVYTAKLTVTDGINGYVNKTYQIVVSDSIEPQYGWNSANIVTASSTTNGAPRYPFDASLSDAANLIWYTTTYPDQYLTMDYGASDNARRVVINEYRIRASSSYLDATPRIFSIQASNDGSNWTQVDNKTIVQNRAIERPTSTNGRNWYNASFANTNGYRYYRVYINSTYVAANVGQTVAIGEMEFRYHDPAKWLQADAYMTGDGYLGIDTYQMRSYYNQTFTVMKGKSVTFKDASIGSPNSWQWDINGDGNYEGLTQDYITTYNTLGLYNATLVAGDGTRTSTKNITVNVVNAVEYAYFQNDAGGTMTASTTTNGNPTYVFDGDSSDSVSTCWHTTTQAMGNTWIQLFYGDGQSHVINEMSIRQIPAYLYSTPRQFIIYGSNDGSNFTVLDKRLVDENRIMRRQVGNAADAWFTYNFTNTNSYKYYRLGINQSTTITNVGYQIAMSEIQFKYHDPTSTEYIIDPMFYVERDGVNGEVSQKDFIGGSWSASSFLNDTSSVLVGRQVQFRDDSLGSPTSWEWDLDGDDATDDSTLEDPTWTYNTAGVYNVTMKATKSGVSKTKTMIIYADTAYEYAYFYKNLNASVGNWGVAYSSIVNGNPAYLFDSDNSDSISTGWQAYIYSGGATGSQEWFSFDYGQFNTSNKKVINEITMRPSASYVADAPMIFKFEGSNDSTTWTMLENRTENPTRYAPRWVASEFRTYGFNNTVPFRYYRLYILASGQDAALSEIALKYHDPALYVENDFWANRSFIQDATDIFATTYNRTVFKNEQIRFVDASLGTNISSYTWDFNGDGATDATTASANWTYASLGTYTVTRNITQNGVVYSKKMYVTVADTIEPMYGAYRPGTNSGYLSVTSGGYYSNGYHYQTIDHNQASPSRWWMNGAPPRWLRYDYGGGNTAGFANISGSAGWVAPTINSYALKSGNAEATYMPKSWRVNASNDGTNWTTMDTQTLVANWTTTETRNYSFVNTVPYRFWNLTVTATQDGSNVAVYEWNLYSTNGTTTPAPTASFTQSSASGTTYGKMVTFTDTSSNTPTTWLWDFGDGYNSTAQNPTHWYSVDDTYTINLTASNAGGTSYANNTYELQSDWDSQVVTWLHFNGTDATNTITDNADPAKAWTASGDAQLDTASVKSGFGSAALLLDGNGDYISTSDSGFDMGSNNVTIETWFKRANADSGVQVIASKGNLTDTGYALYFASNKLSFRANQQAPSTQLTLTSNTTTTDTTTWHHAAVQRRGADWYLYLDGVAVANSTWNNMVTTNAFPFRIGKSDVATNYYFNGSIDEFRYSDFVRWDTATVFSPPYNEYKSDTETSMNFPPVASFTVSSAVKADVTFTVTDTSTNTPDTWAYVWDDGTANGTTKNPTHAYNSSDMLPLTKNYTIHQYVSNPAGSSDSSQTVTVYEFDATRTEIDFMADHTTNVYTGHPVNFTEWSNQSPTAWYWQFGDGQTSTDQNPSHAYANPGNWTVNLTLTTPVYGATKFLSKTDYITTLTENPAPVANFTATPRVGVNGTLIYFTDTSSNTPTSWAWDFNNDGTNESTLHNPTYTYPSIGNYTVKMYATNVFGSNVSVKSGYIEIGNAPIVNFTGAPLDGGTPLLVEFTDLSFNATSYSWDLDGDGDVDSTSRDTNTTYVVAGYYNVSHTATNYYGSNTTNQTNYVHAGGAPVANFTQQKTGMTTVFNDTSTGSPTSWYWDFDDGNTSALQNPTHTFPTAGAYDVNLTATNAYGSGSTVKAAAATNASGFNRQDILMDQQYTLTLTFKDASGSHQLIPIVNVTDSNGDSTMTSVAVAELHYPYGPIVITAMADGYYGTVVSYVITRDRAETIYLTSTTSNSGDSSTSSWAATHNVEFTVKTLFGAPIEDVVVTADYVETSGPLEWLTDWAGVPSNVSVQNTTLTGTTGSDGSIDFLMVESVKYEVTAVKAGVVSKTMTIYPKDDYYVIWADVANASSRYESGYNELEMLSVAVNGTELNTTHGRIHVVYTDLLAQTNSATVYVNKTVVSGNSSTESTVASYTSSAAGNFTHDFDLAGTRDQSYIVRVRSTGDTFTDVERDYGVTFKPGPRSLGIPEPLLVYVGMVLLIFIALMFTRSLPGPATIVIMFFAWIFYFMGWWTNLASDFVVVTALIVYSAIAVLFNVMIRSKKRNFE